MSAASSTGAAVDGLPAQYRLAGGPPGELFVREAAGRVSDDPDAPIRTGRWDAEPSGPALDLAGGPPTDTLVQAAPPPARAVSLAQVAPRATPVLPAPGMARAAFRPAGREVLAGGPPRVTLSMTTDHDPVAPGSGLDPDDDFTGRSLAPRAPRAPREPQRIDAKRMLLSIAPDTSDRKKGRWFIFAAGSGEAFGLNLVKDPARGGYRRAGWSLERLAEFGKAQLGVGWRKGNTQLALSAARREIGAYGFKREDTVFGLTFTVSGKPAQRVKYEHGIPRNTVEPVRR